MSMHGKGKSDVVKGELKKALLAVEMHNLGIQDAREGKNAKHFKPKYLWKSYMRGYRKVKDV